MFIFIFIFSYNHKLFSFVLASFLVDKNMRTKGEILSRVQLLLMNIAIESTIR